MAKLKWDQSGEKRYETGTKKGVLFLQKTDGTYENGVAFNGITAVTESPSGAEETALYADDIKYASLRSAEEFGGTIEAYTYPDEWKQCNGEAELGEGVVIGQQGRKSFGFSFVTTLGNDTSGNDYGYKIHLIYGASISPSEKSYATINDSPDAITFSWEFTTTPVNVTGFKPTAIITIDSTVIASAKLKAIEDMLYGTENAESTLPTPDAIITLLAG